MSWLTSCFVDAGFRQNLENNDEAGGEEEKWGGKEEKWGERNRETSGRV